MTLHIKPIAFGAKGNRSEDKYRLERGVATISRLLKIISLFSRI